jgi:hypothetical protein
MNPILDLASTSAALYLDLIERCLTNTIYGDGYTDWNAPGVERPYDSSLRETGRDWPKRAHTMIGGVRLRNLRELIATAIREGTPGDLIETGAWRGGACIMMRATLEAFGDLERPSLSPIRSRAFRFPARQPIPWIAGTGATLSRSLRSRSTR